MKRTPRSTSRRASRHARAEVAGLLAGRGRTASSVLCGLLAQVDRLGGVLLHLVGQLVAGDAGGEVVLVGPRRAGARSFSSRERVEQVALQRRASSRRAARGRGSASLRAGRRCPA